MATAVVFAYHNVGVRCLSALIAGGVDTRLVVTHADDPQENVWFGSVRSLANTHEIDVLIAEENAAERVEARVRAIAPDFIFSFYYRRMLPMSLLSAAARGAFNMHGSLLPKYRGRVPVNWAIIEGEREAGATLHEMVARPDAGRIVDQLAVPILPNDLAREVFDKVTLAAEMVMVRTLPLLLDGSARLRDQDLSRGSYFSGRKPEDGRLDWSHGARRVHDLVRAVAPPYPGAFCALDGHRLRLLHTVWRDRYSDVRGAPAILLDADRLLIRATDGGLIDVLEAELDGAPLDSSIFRARFPTGIAPLARRTLG